MLELPSCFYTLTETTVLDFKLSNTFEEFRKHMNAPEQQLAESCLFEILSHLQLLTEDDEENTAAYKKIYEEYESLGELLFH